MNLNIIILVTWLRDDSIVENKVQRMTSFVFGTVMNSSFEIFDNPVAQIGGDGPDNMANCFLKMGDTVWLIFVHLILDITPKKKIQWIQVA